MVRSNRYRPPRRILCDTSALVGLACCDERIATEAFSEFRLTTTYTCFKEVREKARHGNSYWLREGAQRVLDFVEDEEIDAPDRVVVPGSPNAGEPNAGEKSLRLVLRKDESFTDVSIYDAEATVLLNRTRKRIGEQTGEKPPFHLVPPNFPLFLSTLRESDGSRLTDAEFCRQTATILSRREWWQSKQEQLFWEYPVDCSHVRE